MTTTQKNSEKMREEKRQPCLANAEGQSLMIKGVLLPQADATLWLIAKALFALIKTMPSKSAKLEEGQSGSRSGGFLNLLGALS